MSKKPTNPTTNIQNNFISTEELKEVFPSKNNKITDHVTNRINTF